MCWGGARAEPWAGGRGRHWAEADQTWDLFPFTFLVPKRRVRRMDSPGRGANDCRRARKASCVEFRKYIITRKNPNIALFRNNLDDDDLTDVNIL